MVCTATIRVLPEQLYDAYYVRICRSTESASQEESYRIPYTQVSSLSLLYNGGYSRSKIGRGGQEMLPGFLNKIFNEVHKTYTYLEITTKNPMIPHK